MDEEQGILGTGKDYQLHHCTVSEYQAVGYEVNDAFCLGEGDQAGNHTGGKRPDVERDERDGKQTE